MHPLNTVKGAITTAFVLAVIIGIALTMWSGMGAAFHPARIDRWLHILSGVMWIGLLYYFNVVQTPGLAAAAADKGGPGGAGITKYIAPRALLWFRWAAVATWVTGVIYLLGGYGSVDASGIVNAFTLQPGYRTIGVGAWLGTIMLFNVWVFDLAESKEDTRAGAGHGRGESGRAQDRRAGIADQFHPLRTAADVHGRPGPWVAVLM